MEDKTDTTTETAAPAPTTPEPAPAPTAPPQDPPITVGRIVHYRAYADVECQRTTTQAALVVAVWGPDCCNLVAYSADGSTTFRSSVRKGDEAGCWSYQTEA